jgi:hypothetical protein
MMGAARTFGTSFDELGDGDGIVFSFAHPLAGEKRDTYHNRQSHSAAVHSPSHDSSHTRSAWNSGGKSLQHSGHVSHVSHVSGGAGEPAGPGEPREPRERGGQASRPAQVSHVSHVSRGGRRAGQPR